ncbi:MAG: hypothetical protein EXR66_09185 [Dehalococcoidia bacterium]|nr:hypothetical protein [Dehalococcoidia bacterium]
MTDATLAAEQSGDRYSFEMAVRGIPEIPGGALALKGAGSVDQRSNRSSLSLNMRALREVLIASGEASAAEFDAAFGDGNVQVIQDGSTVYLRMPMLA